MMTDKKLSPQQMHTGDLWVSNESLSGNTIRVNAPLRQPTLEDFLRNLQKRVEGLEELTVAMIPLLEEYAQTEKGQEAREVLAKYYTQKLS